MDRNNNGRDMVEASNNHNKTQIFYQLMKTQKPAHKIIQRSIKSEYGVVEHNKDRIGQVWVPIALDSRPK